MNAQEQILEYAEKVNKTGDDNQKFVVKMMDGIVIDRTPSSRTFAKITRVNKTVIITETTISETHAVVNGKLVFGESETVIEVLRVEL